MMSIMPRAALLAAIACLALACASGAHSQDIKVSPPSKCGNLSDASGLCSATFVASASWTPVDNSGALLTLTSVTATYQRTGNWVTASFSITYPSTANGANAVISGLPLAVSASGYGFAPGSCYSAAGVAIVIQATALGTSSVGFFNAVTGAAVINSVLSAKSIQCTFVYSAI